MNKLEAIMTLYQNVFPEVEVEAAGSWIRVYPGDGATPPSSYRANELLEDIFNKTGIEYYWNNKDKVIYEDIDSTEVNDQEEPPTKIEAIMELYKSVYPNVKIKQNGTWIKIDHGGEDGRSGESSYRSKDLLEDIFNKTGNVYEWDEYYGFLRLTAAHSDSLWTTSQTDYEGALEQSGYLAPEPVHVTEPSTADKILESYDDVAILANAIKIKADRIRHSNKMVDVRKEGHDIVKLAKRIMNLTGEK